MRLHSFIVCNLFSWKMYGQYDSQEIQSKKVIPILIQFKEFVVQILFILSQQYFQFPFMLQLHKQVHLIFDLVLVYFIICCWFVFVVTFESTWRSSWRFTESTSLHVISKQYFHDFKSLIFHFHYTRTVSCICFVVVVGYSSPVWTISFDSHVTCFFCMNSHVMCENWIYIMLCMINCPLFCCSVVPLFAVWIIQFSVCSPAVK